MGSNLFILHPSGWIPPSSHLLLIIRYNSIRPDYPVVYYDMNSIFESDPYQSKRSDKKNLIRLSDQIHIVMYVNSNIKKSDPTRFSDRIHIIVDGRIKRIRSDFRIDCCRIGSTNTIRTSTTDSNLLPRPVGRSRFPYKFVPLGLGDSARSCKGQA